MIVLDCDDGVCIDNNFKYTNHTRHISRRIHFVRNEEKFNMHKIHWCKVGMKLSDIGTKNVGEPDLTPRMKYIMVRLEK